MRIGKYDMSVPDPTMAMPVVQQASQPQSQPQPLAQPPRDAPPAVAAPPPGAPSPGAPSSGAPPSGAQQLAVSSGAPGAGHGAAAHGGQRYTAHSAHEQAAAPLYYDMTRASSQGGPPPYAYGPPPGPAGVQPPAQPEGNLHGHEQQQRREQPQPGPPRDPRLARHTSPDEAAATTQRHGAQAGENAPYSTHGDARASHRGAAPPHYYGGRGGYRGSSLGGSRGAPRRDPRGALRGSRGGYRMSAPAPGSRAAGSGTVPWRQRPPQRF